MIERDKFVARKIIIEGTKVEILKRLETIFNVNYSLNKLIDGLQTAFSNDKSKLLAKIIQSKDSIVEKELNAIAKQADSFEFDDVLNYLNNLKTEYDKI